MIKRELTDTIVIHCSATPPTMDIGVDKIREWHVGENKWDDVGYHFIITRGGTIEPARPEEMQGSHNPATNYRSVAVCMIGGSDANGDWENNFNDAQFVTLKSLILDLIKRYEVPEDFKQIKKIIGHYQVDDKKECPSFNVPDWLEKEGFQDYVV
jgi:N-acetyl-anhydromuramyl-L-alanine amidase AmpD